MTQTELDRQLLTAQARLLIDIYQRVRQSDTDTIAWTELHKEYGSKLYNQAYGLALLGLITISGEGRNKKVSITPKGSKIAECLIKCLNI